MSRKYEIQLASGVSIHLHALLQGYTYAGLVDGIPIRRLNKRLVEGALKDARERLWFNGKPYLIPPEETPMGHLREDWVSPLDEFEPVTIPGVTCLATFESQTPARDPEAHMSMLNVVWFQDELALPVDPQIIEKIRAIEWNAHAEDGYY